MLSAVGSAVPTWVTAWGLQSWRQGTRLQRRTLAVYMSVIGIACLMLAACLAWRALLWSFACLWGIFRWVFWDPPLSAAITETLIMGEQPAFIKLPLPCVRRGRRLHARKACAYMARNPLCSIPPYLSRGPLAGSPGWRMLRGGHVCCVVLCRKDLCKQPSVVRAAVCVCMKPRVLLPLLLQPLLWHGVGGGWSAVTGLYAVLFITSEQTRMLRRLGIRAHVGSLEPLAVALCVTPAYYVLVTYLLTGWYWPAAMLCGMIILTFWSRSGGGARAPPKGAPRPLSKPVLPRLLVSCCVMLCIAGREPGWMLSRQ